MSRIVLESVGVDFEQRLRRALNGLSEEVRIWAHSFPLEDPAGVVDDLTLTSPNLLLIGSGAPIDQALVLAAALREHHPEVSVLLVAQPGPDLWEPALRAGVVDVLAPEASTEEIRTTLDHALAVFDRRRANLVRGGGAQPDESGRVITVLSPKGGVGKTAISANLSVGLAQHAPGEVAVIDLDLEFGDINSALLLTPEHTMADATRSERLDPTTLKVFLTHHPANLYALCAPPSPEEGEEVKPERVSAVVRLLREEFSYVVIDTAAGLGEHTLAALELSTDIVLVSDMDVPSVRALRKAVHALDRLGMTGARRHVVLNRSDARVGLSVDDIKATLGQEVDVEVSSSRLMPLAVNQGSPVLESNPRSSVGKQLARLVERFVEVPASRSSSLIPWRS